MSWWDVDWPKIRVWALMGLIGALLTGVTPWAWDRYWEFVQLHDDTYSHIEEAQGNVSQLSVTLNKIIARQDRQLRVVGTAVVGEFGPDESFIRINLGSSAGLLYADDTEAWVTITTPGGSVRYRLPIKGQITSNRGYILQFSEGAARELGITEESVWIKLEPIEG